MERNAAGDVVSSSHLHRPSAHVPPPPAPSPMSVRFKLYFATHPAAQFGSSSSIPGMEATSPPAAWIENRSHQLAHLMIPYRLPFSTEFTLQDLADQATSRIAKRYAALTSRYVIEGFDVVPLVWDGFSSASSPLLQHDLATSSPGAAVSNPASTAGKYQSSTARAHSPQRGVDDLPSPSLASSSRGGGSTGWRYDTTASYRLDLAMNGPDDVEFYFSLPSPTNGALPMIASATAAVSLSNPPPFELIILWRLRDGANAEFGYDTPRTPQPPYHHPYVPHRPASTDTSAVGMMNGGRSSPLVCASTKPPLPPIQHQRAGTPLRLPALEPRKPSDGAARYHRQSSPLLDAAERESTGHTIHESGDESGGGAPSSVRQSDEWRGLRRYLPHQNSDPALDGSANNTPQRGAVSPLGGSIGKPSSGRRSVTTFVVADSSAEDILLPTAPAASTRNTSPDSEANFEDTVGFQAQLIVLTEAEDRDTVVMQEEMEVATFLRTHVVELAMCGHNETHRPHGWHQPAASKTMSLASPTNAARGGPPIVYDTRIALPMHHHSSLEADAHDGAAVLSSPSPPSVRTTMQRTDSPEFDRPPASVVVPHRNSKPEVSGVKAEQQTSVVCRSRSEDTIPISAASVHSALAFASAPTSKAVQEMLRHSSEEAARRAESDDALVEREEDGELDEAISLACDELLNEWLHLRHSVLTDERKHFRVITQQLKMVQRDQHSETTQSIRDEALAQHARIRAITEGHLGSPSPPRVAAALGMTDQIPSPPVAVTSRRAAAEVSPMSLSYEEEARGVGLTTPLPGGTHPTPPQSNQRHNITSGDAEVLTAKPPRRAPPPTALDEALVRLVRIVDVTEQADRRELVDAQLAGWHRMVEERAIESKRIELRAEQALITQSRNILKDEEQCRMELMEVEDRKFSMFAGLCNKGIARLKAAAAARTTRPPLSGGEDRWSEL